MNTLTIDGKEYEIEKTISDLIILISKERDNLQEDNKRLIAENVVIMELLKVAKCPDEYCVDGVSYIGDPQSPDFEQCQWCYESKQALTNTSKQTALVQEVLAAAVKLSDAYGEGHPLLGESYWCCPVDVVLESAVRKMKESL